MTRARGREGAFTAHLMKRWKIDGTIANPPSARGIPRSVPHLYQYAIDMAYIPPIEANEPMKAFKRRIEGVLLRLEYNAIGRPAMRIEQKHPEVTWKRVWINLHTTGLADTVTSKWYAAIHNIIPIRQCLAAIKLAPNTTCVICGEIDTHPQF
jgi:hypothetical protein